MSVKVLRRSQWLPRPRAEVFDFFRTPANLAKLTPSWLGFHVLTPEPLDMRAGALFDYTVRPLGFPQYWRTRIESYEPPLSFVDTQEKGPYKLWHHTHTFVEENGGTRVSDEVHYELPFQPFGELAHREIARRLRDIFDYREAAVAALFPPKEGSMKIIIAGGSGWIGRALSRELIKAGHRVIVLSRSGSTGGVPGATGRAWLIPGAVGWKKELEGADAVINLCGEGVADRFWTESRRRALVDSRLAPTRALTAAMAEATVKPRVFISASAVGIYGQDRVEELDEKSSPATGFLADLCARWEASALEAEKLGVRVVLPRIGVVLGADGGALKRMLPPFRLGLGGRLGDGRQWFPWVHLDDVVGLIVSALSNEKLRGPVNAVSPESATNQEFTAALARAVRRPAVFPVPGFVLRAGLGEMSSLLLGSQKIAPKATLDAGYAFRRAALGPALEQAAA